MVHANLRCLKIFVPVGIIAVVWLSLSQFTILQRIRSHFDISAVSYSQAVLLERIYVLEEELKQMQAAEPKLAEGTVKLPAREQVTICRCTVHIDHRTVLLCK